MEAQEATGQDKPQETNEAKGLAEEKVTVTIELSRAGVKVIGNVPMSRHVTLGMIEEAKIQLLGFYAKNKMAEQYAKEQIVKPGHRDWVKNMFRKKP